MKLPEIKKGVVIKILKNDLSLVGITPAKNSYLVRGETGRDWSGTGYTHNKGTPTFKIDWSLNTGEVNEQYNEGNISVHYPDEDVEYDPQVGDVFMVIGAAEKGITITITKVGQVDIVTEYSTGEKGKGFSRDTFKNIIKCGTMVLVGGPSMTIYNHGVQFHSCNLSEEPKDNGSRDTCFWCRKATVPMDFGFGMSRARFCEHCKK